MTPDAQVDRVADIPLELLAQWGVRGVLLDLDNTIVPWHTADLIAGIGEWVERLARAGIRVCLLTNNYSWTAATVGRALEVDVVKGALKPLPSAFRAALRTLGMKASQCVVVGDQIFTDVLGGKLSGMRAILVRPLGGREFVTTRFFRFLERRLLRRGADSEACAGDRFCGGTGEASST